jgi:hypothetical protein
MLKTSSSSYLQYRKNSDTQDALPLQQELFQQCEITLLFQQCEIDFVVPGVEFYQQTL